MKAHLTLSLLISVVLSGWSSVVAQDINDEQTIRDAYVYLLGRALVIRQEQTDMQEEGVDYNVIKYNPAGSADFVNPNLDVAYLEAWIAVDDQTPVMLEVPEVKGRYYTAQILNEWVRSSPISTSATIRRIHSASSCSSRRDRR